MRKGRYGMHCKSVCMAANDRSCVSVYVCVCAAIFVVSTCGCENRIYYEMKFISMRKKFRCEIKKRAHGHIHALTEKKSLVFIHSSILVALNAVFCSISHLEHFTSAPFRFNCTHCKRRAAARSLALQSPLQKYLDN